jgi:plasmid stabilization system protein ParE
MMVRYRSRAQEDVADIYDRIARDSATAAQRVENTIRRAVGMLATEPELCVDIGHQQTRRWPMTEYKYTVFYGVDWAAEYIEIVRVVESARVRNLNRIRDDSRHLVSGAPLTR